ncbi:MAG: phage major capsid protein [Phycisphaerae bacterium]|nr:phage major capsid protein [Phycisphaerae bacterium]
MARNPYGATNQDQQFDQLHDEIAATVERTGRSLAEQTRKTQDTFAAHARDIRGMEIKLQEQSMLLREVIRGGHVAGGLGTGGEGLGKLCIALASNNHAALQQLQTAGVNSGTGESGGALLASTITNTIIRNVDQYSVIESNAKKIQVDAQRTVVPKRTAGVIVTHPDLGVDITESSPKFGGVPLELAKYAALAAVDNSMLRDSLALPLTEFLITEFAQAFAYVTDLYALVGDGTPAHAKTTGLFNLTADSTNGVKDVTADTGDNTFQEVIDKSTVYLAKALAELPQWAEFFNPAWIMSRSIFFGYMGVRDGQNRPIADVKLGGKGEKPYSMLMGYPVLLAQVAPRLADSAASKTMAVLTPLMASVLIGRDAQGMEIKISDAPFFRSDQTAFRAIMRQQIALADGTAVVRIRTAAS